MRPSASSSGSARVSTSRWRPSTSASRPRSRSGQPPAAPEDALAAAHLLQGWLDRAARADEACGARSASSPSLLLTAACGGGDATAPQTDRGRADPRNGCAIIFPEGFTVRDMGDRVDAVRTIAIETRGVTPRLTKAGYLAAVAKARPPKAFLADWKHSWRAFSFRPCTSSRRRRPGQELVADQFAAFRKRFATVGLRYAKSKNLTPYDVLIIASMIEKEAAVAKERQADRRGDLQPAPRRHAARDRCHPPLRPRHPRRRSRSPRPRCARIPVQHRAS